jgi:hypothetical protein
MDPRLVAQLAARSSHFRGADWRDPASARFKEWLHFCVLAPGIELLVNLSIAGRPARERAAESAFVARLVVMARSHGRWLGSVEEVPASQVSLRPGQVDAVFGDTALRCQSGAFELLLRPRAIPLSARLRLEPVTLPLMRSKTSLGEGLVNWLAVPRLRAFGSITADGTPHVLRGQPAYHDHNWGTWRWGRDFFWQWAFGLPSSADDPWTLVFYRLFDRARTVENALSVLVWRGDQLFRVFHQGDVAVSPQGFLRRASILKVPPVMGLLAPQLTTDVAERIVVEAGTGKDHLRFEIDNQDLAQVLIPSESDLGTTVINEVVGTYRGGGSIQGVSVETQGQSFHEHVTWS